MNPKALQRERAATDFDDLAAHEHAPVGVDMKRVKARKDAIFGRSRAGLEVWLKGMANCTVYKGHARFEAGNAPREGFPGLVEDGQFVFPRQIVLDVPVGVEDRYGLARLGVTVAPPTHPVAGTIGEELEPLAKAPLIQELGFALSKLLHLLGQIVIHLWLLRSHPGRHLRHDGFRR